MGLFDPAKQLILVFYKLLHLLACFFLSEPHNSVLGLVLVGKW